MTDIKKMIDIARSLGMDERARLLEFYEERLVQDNKDLVLPLVGAFSSGKSSLINSLLDKPVLEVGGDPTTASIIEVRFGAPECMEAVSGDGTLTRVYDTSTRVSPSTLLVDTPGMLSGKAEHQMALADYLPNADAILLLVDVQPLLDKSTIEGVKQFVGASKISGRPFYGVLTKCESKSPAEIERAKEYLRTEAGIDFADVVTVSVKEGWMDEFNALLANIQSNKNEIVERAVEERVKAVAREMISDINTLLRESNTLSELDEAIGRSQTQLRSVNRNIDTLLADMDQKVEDDVDEACMQFKSIIATQLNTIVTAKGRDADRSVFEAANATGALVMETFQRRVIADMVAIARQRQDKLDGVPMAALESLNFAEECFNGFTYDIDLSRAGHEHDKKIGKTVVVAAAVAAVIASWGSAAPAAAGAVKGAGAVATGAQVVDAVGDVAIATQLGRMAKIQRAAGKALKATELAFYVKNKVDTMDMVSEELGQRAGAKRGILETSVGWITEWHAKSARLRAISDYIDDSLVPQLRPQLISAGQLIVRQAATLLRDEAAAVTGGLERSLQDLRQNMADQKEDYARRMAMYREFARQLNDMQ